MSELPTKARNVLRTSKDPFAQVSLLRPALGKAHFPALVKWLATYGQRSYEFHISRRPRTVSALRAERRVMSPPLSLKGELAWACATFENHASFLQTFIDARREFVEMLLERTYEESLSALDQIESNLGYSFWSVEIRFALLQLAHGLESQKAYLAKLREQSRNNIVAFIAYFLSERNEDTTNPERFRTTLISTLPRHTTSSEFATYALFRLADHWDTTPSSISTLLRWEYNSSLIDYYEAFLRLVTRLISERSPLSPSLALILSALDHRVSDERIKKVAFFAGGGAASIAPIKQPRLDALDAYCEGRLSDAVTMAADESQKRHPDSLIVTALACADQRTSEIPAATSQLWSRLAEHLIRVMAKVGSYEEAYADLIRISTNLQNTHFAATIAYFAKLAVSADHWPDDPLALKAAIYGDGFPPFSVQFMAHAERECVAQFFRERLGVSSAVQTELLRSNV